MRTLGTLIISFRQHSTRLLANGGVSTGMRPAGASVGHGGSGGGRGGASMSMSAVTGLEDTEDSKDTVTTTQAAFTKVLQSCHTSPLHASVGNID
ncbi:hypothetical protein E2C01_070623 [Portunus trituberculatus]|uniref:Uncharacterized protein n=1 Tax=Portunus trituberculatus TaxID=210409 RepID=A0A5B7I2K9_PORTR|nr:hypothetical protein [Portunus trituberculatus]